MPVRKNCNNAAAVETARAAIQNQTTGKKTRPVVFAECHDAWHDDPPLSGGIRPRRGRARTQPPEHLRDRMPEHGDAAYFAAQAELRAPAAVPPNATVPPSDYHHGGPRLHPEELQGIADLYTEKYGPILSLEQAANVTKLSKQTLRRYVCEGKFAASVFRDRPLRFVTQRLLEEVLG